MNLSKDRASAGLALALVALLLIPSAWAGKPEKVDIRTMGTFDANLILSGTFTATGAINVEGTLVDSPRFKGQSIHIDRTMTTADGATIALRINANHVTGTGQPDPAWCARPATIPPGMELFTETGNWQVKNGTGKYAALSGEGPWASRVIRDKSTKRPFSAQECFSGTMQVD